MLHLRSTVRSLSPTLARTRPHKARLAAPGASVGNNGVGFVRAFDGSGGGRPAKGDGYGEEYTPCFQKTVMIAHKRGTDLLNDPVFNKGTGFALEERRRLGLDGLLPPRNKNLSEQITRALGQYFEGERRPSEAEGVSAEQVRKWNYLNNLKDRNEGLYYKLIVDNFIEMAPIIYTPTVGWACANHGHLFSKPRGMYFSALDKGHMDHMVYNWHADEVDAIVVTDGSRILGLGDLGIGGIGISVGKLDLYVGAAGFHPDRVLPCVLDVGTNNKELINDPDYLGLRQPRLKGQDYVELVDEFVASVMQRWPRAILQFEDFSTNNALKLLERYRYHHNMFNDDIQGTAATALSGIYGALKVQGKKPQNIKDLKFVVVGAGSAGMGVTDFLCQAMVSAGLSQEEAVSRFYILDADGLITDKRTGLDPNVQKFARTDGVEDGMDCLSVVSMVKPHVLMGLSGAGKIFTSDILTEFGKHHERPILFPMSNPTHKLECTAEEGQKACGGRAIFASGSPQKDVIMEDGKVVASCQSNNMYVFPGLALGAKLVDTKMVSDCMLMAAAEAVTDLLTEKDLSEGRVYPSLKNIRSISKKVAARVMVAADKDDLTNIAPGKSSGSRMWAIRNLIRDGDEERLERYIQMRMYEPQYEDIVYMPPGIME